VLLTFALGACGGGPRGTSTTGGAGGGGTSSTTTTGAAGSGNGGAGPTVPTVSSWLGTNINADLPRIDITYQLQPFDTPDAQKDANGYPVAGASGTSSTDIGFVLPTGTYKISYKGGGTLTVGGIGTIAGAWTTVGGEQRNEIQITGTPGSFGHFLELDIAATLGKTVTDIHILMPGFDYDTKQIFHPQFSSLLAPFRALRFMEWENINGSTLSDWADRPQAAHFGTSPHGQPFEHIVALVNETGKDCWINVPEHATDELVHQLAQFLAQNLDWDRIAAARKAQGLTAPFQLLVETANETWNGGFTAYQTFLDAAKMNPSRYTGVYDGTYAPSWMSGNSDLMKVGQFEADRLVQIGSIFREELMAVGKAEIVAPVLAGWALGAAYSDVGLRFIQQNHGDPKTFVSYVALAPYFGPDDAQTGSLDTLFASANQNIAAMDATFQDFAKLAKEYGIQVAGYEGGQGISGATNQPIKHLAQHDARMHDAYTTYFALWKKNFGESLFMHFDLAGTPGLPENIFQYGYWGSIISALEDPAACSPNLPTLTGTEDIASVIHHCPKYRALAEQVPR
jgi:hypothetical protein